MTELINYPQYLLYEDGRVWSKKSNIFLKPAVREGYLRIGLCKNNKMKRFTIHRLLALYFIPNPNNYLEVDHINKIRHDNRLENLRWANREIQMNNTNLVSSSGEKNIYITINTTGKYSYKYYRINIYNKTKLLRYDKYTLQDAINLRDSLIK